MRMKERLGTRLGVHEVKDICRECGSAAGSEMREEIFSCISDEDDRVSYNALWVLTHLPSEHRGWLALRRDEMVTQLLRCSHKGKMRLLLTILEDLPVNEEDVRTDYLDFCLSKINSNEPYAIRALSLKQAFAQCRFYPELLHELQMIMDVMTHGELSPGLLSARRIVMKKIAEI